MPTPQKEYDIAIVGGGLGGLVLSYLLAEQGHSVILFEKKHYPFHRVCGEYISNEVVPFLERTGLFPRELSPSKLTKFQLTSVSGQSLEMPLDLGGFGISRFEYDHWLVQKVEKKVNVLQGVAVREVTKTDGGYAIRLNDDGLYKVRLVVGSFGKRSSLDKKMDRPFINKTSPYIGVKYHIKAKFDVETVALHNFEGGYCGINKIEGDKYNLCYLSTSKNLKAYGSIQKMESEILQRNPHLKRIFNESEFLFDKPEVINEISFDKKGPVYDDIPMVGDAAGMITPLCGNGMAMAIHSASILAEVISENTLEDQRSINNEYESLWTKYFSRRLWAGRNIQKLFGGGRSSNFAVGLGKSIRPIAEFLMSKTHGRPF